MQTADFTAAVCIIFHYIKFKKFVNIILFHYFCIKVSRNNTDYERLPLYNYFAAKNICICLYPSLINRIHGNQCQTNRNQFQ